MSDNILTEMVFRVRIHRSGDQSVGSGIWEIYVTALNDLLARGMAIEISNIQLSRYWKCTVAEVEEKSLVVLCDVRRIKVSGGYVQVKSLV